LNDVVTKSFASAGVPVTKEPVGLARQDGKRPHGLTRQALHVGRHSGAHASGHLRERDKVNSKKV